MAALPFGDAGFDFLWSEGAIYIVGFEAGLRQWRRLLLPGGVVAVTELSWLRPKAPQDAVEFWAAEYPAMQSIDENLETLEGAGYRILGHFILPQSDWWSGYYGPLQENARRFEEKYRGDETAAEVLSMERQEMAIYSRHADSYGYVFYIAART
jgi:ubiquinone/menaquinone biosynthesis C-methylase UbiE